MVRIISIRTVALAAAISWLAPGLLSANDWRSLECDPSAELGSWSCAATACHGGSGEQRRSGGELELWRNSDPHASAGSLIETPAFAEILLRLNVITALGDDTRPGKRVALITERSEAKVQECMNCHNPRNVPTSWTPLEDSPDTVSIDNLSDGFAISCETCHGAAKDWIGKHYRRDFAREEHGFHDLKNLVVRGRTCAQCHIGDEQRDMNHDMIAAGHPPLRFELASYQRALPKHWNDSRQRANTRDYELKLWLAGQIANFDTGLSLLESRLARSQSKEVIDDPSGRHPRPSAPWPEFAESNCSSCHQRLRAATEWDPARPRPYGQQPTLMWSTWNLGAMESILLGERATAPLREESGNLRTVLSTSSPPSPSSVRDFHMHCRQQINADLWRSLRPQASLVFPASLEARLSVNYDEQLQSYALLMAHAKNSFDVEVKARGVAGRPPVVDDLAQIRSLLQPRNSTGPEQSSHAFGELKRLHSAAAEKLK